MKGHPCVLACAHFDQTPAHVMYAGVYLGRPGCAHVCPCSPTHAHVCQRHNAQQSAKYLGNKNQETRQ